MTLDVAGREGPRPSPVVERATVRFKEAIAGLAGVQVHSVLHAQPDMRPGEEGFRALDFVQLGINEKTERRLGFLLIVTEVEVAAASLSYLLALPSQLTNVAIASTRRLADYGSDQHEDVTLMGARLGALLVHCFGRLLNLDYVDDERNYMSQVSVPADLDAMSGFTTAQRERMAHNLPLEANDRFSEGSRAGFVLTQTLANLPGIIRGAVRANPLRLATKMPTMVATALSVIVVLIFGGETWDFAASASTGQMAIFVVASFVMATFVLYRAFSFRLVDTRHGHTSESAVVTAGATYLALVLTLLCLFFTFALLMYGVVVFVFPDPLMDTWTSVKDGHTLGAHLRLVSFLGAVGVLSGSLGGSADSRSVVRNVLFAVDET